MELLLEEEEAEEDVLDQRSGSLLHFHWFSCLFFKFLLCLGFETNLMSLLLVKIHIYLNLRFITDH